MTLEGALAVAIICTVGLFILFVLTDKTTPEERDEMLKDEDMWP